MPLDRLVKVLRVLGPLRAKQGYQGLNAITVDVSKSVVSFAASDSYVAGRITLPPDAARWSLKKYRVSFIPDVVAFQRLLAATPRADKGAEVTVAFGAAGVFGVDLLGHPSGSGWWCSTPQGHLSGAISDKTPNMLTPKLWEGDARLGATAWNPALLGKVAAAGNAWSQGQGVPKPLRLCRCAELSPALFTMPTEAGLFEAILMPVRT
jgi:hypothetical protein